MSGAVSGKSQVPKPRNTRQRAGSQSRLTTYLRYKWASCVGPDPKPEGEASRARSLISASAPLKAELEQKLLPGRRVGAKDPQHAAGDHRGPVFVDPAGSHALVRRLNDYADTMRLQHGLKRIGDFRRQPLLHLKALREGVDETGQLRDPDHPFVRE